MKPRSEHVTAARSSRALPADPFCSSLVEAATATLEESTGHAERALDRLVRATEASASRDPAWHAHPANHLRPTSAAASAAVREGSPDTTVTW